MHIEYLGRIDWIEAHIRSLNYVLIIALLPFVKQRAAPHTAHHTRLRRAAFGTP
jgi:hypothetical protein